MSELDEVNDDEDPKLEIRDRSQAGQGVFSSDSVGR